MIYRNFDNGPIDRFCAKHPRLGVPNLMIYIIIGQVAVFVLNLLTQGMVGMALQYFGPYILRGQVWRLVTFILIPDNDNPFFFLLGCYVYFWTAKMLEREWGTAKFNLFYFSGLVLSALSGLVLGYADISYIHLSFFLVLATLFGEMQVYLYFAIPIKMKWMALINVALILVDVVKALQAGLWFVALLPLASFVNYFIFTWPFWAMKLGRAGRQADPRVINFKRAQRQAQKKAKETGGYLHKCAVCGLTDQDDPNMEFRYCSKCDGYYCYCANHINNHIHIRQD